MAVSPARQTVHLPTHRVEPVSVCRTPHRCRSASPRALAEKDVGAVARNLMRYVQNKGADTRYDLPDEKFFTGREVIKEIDGVYSRCLACVEDRVWTGNKDGSITVYDLQSGEKVDSIPKAEHGFVTSIRQVGLNVWVGFSDGMLRVYDPETLSMTKACKEHTCSINDILVSFNGLSVYTSGADFAINLWDASKVERVGSLSGHKGAVRCLTFCSGVRLFSGGDDGLIIEWDTFKLRPLTIIKGHKGSVRCLTAAGSTLWSGGEDGTVRVWNISNESLPENSNTSLSRNVSNRRWSQFCPEVTLENLYMAPTCMHIIGNPHTSVVSRLITVGAKVWSICLGTIFIWNTATFELEGQFKEYGDYITCIDTVHQSLVARIWTCGNDGVLKMWNTESQWLSAFKANEMEHLKMMDVLLQQGIRKEAALESALTAANTRIEAFKRELEQLKRNAAATNMKEGSEPSRGAKDQAQDRTNIDSLEKELRQYLHDVCESDRECLEFKQRGGIDYSMLDDAANFSKKDDATRHPFADPVFAYDSWDNLNQALKDIRSRHGGGRVDPFGGQDEVLARWKKGDDGFGNCLVGAKKTFLADGTTIPLTETSKLTAQSNEIRMSLLVLQAQLNDVIANTSVCVVDEAQEEEANRISKPVYPGTEEMISGTWAIPADVLSEADVTTLADIKQHAFHAVAEDRRALPDRVGSELLNVNKEETAYPAALAIVAPANRTVLDKLKEVCGVIPIPKSLNAADRATLGRLRQKYNAKRLVIGAKDKPEDTKNLGTSSALPFLDWRKSPTSCVHLVAVRLADGSLSNFTMGFLTTEELSPSDLKILQNIITTVEKRERDGVLYEPAAVEMFPNTAATPIAQIKVLNDIVHSVIPTGLVIPPFHMLTTSELDSVYNIYKKYRTVGTSSAPSQRQDATSVRQQGVGSTDSASVPPGVISLFDSIQGSTESVLGLLLLQQQVSKDAINNLAAELREAQQLISNTPALCKFLANGSQNELINESAAASQRNEQLLSGSADVPYGTTKVAGDALLKSLQVGGQGLVNRLKNISKGAELADRNSNKKESSLQFITCAKAIHDICTRGARRLRESRKSGTSNISMCTDNPDAFREQFMLEATNSGNDRGKQIETAQTALFQAINKLSSADKKHVKSYVEQIMYGDLIVDQCLDSDLEDVDKIKTVSESAVQTLLPEDEIGFVVENEHEILRLYRMAAYNACRRQADAEARKVVGVGEHRPAVEVQKAAEKMINAIPLPSTGPAKSWVERCVVDASRLSVVATLLAARVEDQAARIKELEGRIVQERRIRANVDDNEKENQDVAELQQEIVELREQLQEAQNANSDAKVLEEVLRKTQEELRGMYRQWEHRNYLAKRPFGDLSHCNLAEQSTDDDSQAHKLKVQFMEEKLGKEDHVSADVQKESKTQSISTNPYSFLDHNPISGVLLDDVLDMALNDRTYKRLSDDRTRLVAEISYECDDFNNAQGQDNKEQEKKIEALTKQVSELNEQLNKVVREVAVAHKHTRLSEATAKAEKGMNSGEILDYSKDNLEKIRRSMVKYEEQAESLFSIEKEALLKDNTVLREDLKAAQERLHTLQREVNKLREKVESVAPSEGVATQRAGDDVEDKAAISLLNYAKKELMDIRACPERDRQAEKLPAAAGITKEVAAMQEPIDEAAEKALDEIYMTQLALARAREKELMEEVARLRRRRASKPPSSPGSRKEETMTRDELYDIIDELNRDIEKMQKELAQNKAALKNMQEKRSTPFNQSTSFVPSAGRISVAPPAGEEELAGALSNEPSKYITQKRMSGVPSVFRDENKSPKYAEEREVEVPAGVVLQPAYDESALKSAAMVEKTLRGQLEDKDKHIEELKDAMKKLAEKSEAEAAAVQHEILQNIQKTREESHAVRENALIEEVERLNDALAEAESLLKAKDDEVISLKKAVKQSPQTANASPAGLGSEPIFSRALKEDASPGATADSAIPALGGTSKCPEDVSQSRGADSGADSDEEERPEPFAVVTMEGEFGRFSEREFKKDFSNLTAENPKTIEVISGYAGSINICLTFKDLPEECKKPHKKLVKQFNNNPDKFKNSPLHITGIRFGKLKDLCRNPDGSVRARVPGVSEDEVVRGSRGNVSTSDGQPTASTPGASKQGGVHYSEDKPEEYRDPANEGYLRGTEKAERTGLNAVDDGKFNNAAEFQPQEGRHTSGIEGPRDSKPVGSASEAERGYPNREYDESASVKAYDKCPRQGSPDADSPYQNKDSGSKSAPGKSCGYDNFGAIRDGSSSESPYPSGSARAAEHGIPQHNSEGYSDGDRRGPEDRYDSSLEEGSFSNDDTRQHGRHEENLDDMARRELTEEEASQGSVNRSPRNVKWGSNDEELSELRNQLREALGTNNEQRERINTLEEEVESYRNQLVALAPVEHDERKYQDGRDAELDRLHELLSHLEGEVQRNKDANGGAQIHDMEAFVKEMEKKLNGPNGHSEQKGSMEKNDINSTSTDPAVTAAIEAMKQYYEDRERGYRDVNRMLKKQLQRSRYQSDLDKISRLLSGLGYLYETRPTLIASLYQMYKLLMTVLSYTMKQHDEVAVRPLTRGEAMAQLESITNQINDIRIGNKWIIANLFTQWELHHIGASPSMFPPDTWRPTWRDIEISKRLFNRMMFYSRLGQHPFVDNKDFEDILRKSHSSTVKNCPLLSDEPPSDAAPCEYAAQGDCGSENY